nr:prolyl oligopeptidase family serine peptidase [uncultured Devosia sp.]
MTISNLNQDPSPTHPPDHVKKTAGTRACFTLIIGAALTSMMCSNSHAADSTALKYPVTQKVDVVDEAFGTAIHDPYRWLEADIRQSADVTSWIDAQNDLSAPYLAGLTQRDVFRERMTALYAGDTLSVPRKYGDRYFFQRQSASDNQVTLVMRDGENASDEVILDPNAWSEDGTSALGHWSASMDGSRIAFARHEGGSDWATIEILDVASGKVLEDKLEWARFTSIAWLKDGSGFFYGGHKEPAADVTFEAPSVDHAIYFHRLGTPQSEDRLVFSTQLELPLIHTIEATEDGTYAVITSTPLNGSSTVSVIDMQSKDWDTRTIVPGVEHAWSFVGKVGPTLYLKTDQGSGSGKIVGVDLSKPDLTMTDIVVEQDNGVLLNANIVGRRLVLSYMNDARTEVRRFTLTGEPDGGVELPGIGTAGDFQGQLDNDEAFFVFSSFNVPTTIYSYNVATGETSVWSEPELDADLDSIKVEQQFYQSKDGTRIPIFIISRDDVDEAAPTLLSGYGGFGIPMFPFFSPDVVAWVEQGGVFAFANIRGGGEYGKPWHDAGRLLNKQNVFDDFIAAGEFLKAQNISTQDGLAIYGASNGGLLMGAVVNQQPDLFAAALIDVGVLDMLRFNQFTGGPLWMQEYGNPAVEADFRNLLSYSPLHNITSGSDYPAILVTTGDTDNRVVPAHSFKYTATLQAAEIGDRPHILRVETQAGHGAGKPISKMIEQGADMWAFAARWTGLTIENSPSTVD